VKKGEIFQCRIEGVGVFEVGTRIVVLQPSRMTRKPGKVTIILDSWWPATVTMVTDAGVFGEFDDKSIPPFFIDWGSFRAGYKGDTAMARISTVIDRLAELA
jgi:hypothetical protein